MHTIPATPLRLAAMEGRPFSQGTVGKWQQVRVLKLRREVNCQWMIDVFFKLSALNMCSRADIQSVYLVSKWAPILFYKHHEQPRPCVGAKRFLCRSGTLALRLLAVRSMLDTEQ